MVTLSLPDFVMVLVIVGFGAFGFALGLVQVVGGLVGIIAGAWISSTFYRPLGAAIGQYFPGRGAGDAAAFVILFVLVNRASAAVFFVINRIFRLLSFIPFLKSFNRLLGGIFGLLEGALLLGIVVRVVEHFSAFPWVATIVSRSLIAGWLLALVELLAPLLPALLSVGQAPTPVPYGSPTVI